MSLFGRDGESHPVRDMETLTMSKRERERLAVTAVRQGLEDCGEEFQAGKLNAFQKAPKASGLELVSQQARAHPVFQEMPRRRRYGSGDLSS
jgi:hypothetical protein